MMNKQRGHFMKIKKLFIFFISTITCLFCITGCSNNDSKKEFMNYFNLTYKTRL